MKPEQNPQPPQPDNTNQQPQVFGPQQSPAPSGAPLPPAAPSSPSPVAGGPSAGEDKPKRRFHFSKRILAFVAIIIIGLGAGAYAYWQVLNNSPEKVLADALANTMTDVLDKKPMTMAGTFKIESKDESAPFSMTLDMDAKQSGDNGQFSAKATFDAGAGFDISVNATVVAEGSDVMYVKLDNVRKTVDDLVRQSPAFGLYAEAYDPVIDKTDGKWIKIDEKALADLGLAPTEEKADKCAEELGKLRISKDDRKRVKEIFQKNQFAIVSEELPAEDVEGDSSFHYKLDLNEEAGLRFAKDFIELQSFAGVKQTCEIEQKDLDESLESFKEQTNQGDEEVDTKPVFELWVSEDTRRPAKLKVTFDNKEVSMENITTVKLDAKDVKVEIPTDAMTLQDLQTEIEKSLSSNGLPGWSDLREETQ